jgi:hypothetical protein
MTLKMPIRNDPLKMTFCEFPDRCPTLLRSQICVSPEPGCMSLCATTLLSRVLWDLAQDSLWWMTLVMCIMITMSRVGLKTSWF